MTTKRTKGRIGPFEVERIESSDIDALHESLSAASPRGRIRRWRPHAERLGVAGGLLNEAETLMDDRGAVEEMDRFDALLAQAQLEIERAQNETLDLYGNAGRLARGQRDKANKRWANNQQVTNAITRIACNPDHADLTPGELWPHLYAALDEMGLEPNESGRGLKKAYNCSAGTIQYEAFRRQVRRARQ